MTAPGPRPIDPDVERAHRRRPTVREVLTEVGREIAGLIMFVGGVAGIGITVTILAGLTVAILVGCAITAASGVVLLFRPE